jgi:uncharacterized protein (TIRG00374 family)
MDGRGAVDPGVARMIASFDERRLARALIASAALAAAGYLGFSIWAGSAEVAAGLREVGFAGALVALGLALTNYALRFLRWQNYLAALGHPMPSGPSAVIYLSGFAFTTTPGKAGELLRGVFLAHHGVPMRRAAAAFVSERLSDLLAVLVICLPGLAVLPRGAPLVAVGIAGVGAVGLALAFGDRIHRLIERRWGARESLVARLARKISLLLNEAGQCHRPGVLAGASLLSILAWSAEAFAFHFVLTRLGVDVGLPYAMAVYALAMLAGALSFLPGGLGGTEAVMVAALTLKGVPEPSAVAATIIIRLATLWFAVALGLLALVAGKKALYPSEFDTPSCETT